MGFIQGSEVPLMSPKRAPPFQYSTSAIAYATYYASPALVRVHLIYITYTYNSN